MNDWPLQESDISEDVCKRCALCCSMDLRPGWADPRMMDALKVMVEKSPDIEFTRQGIRIQCSHLRKIKVSNVVANEFWECSIYDKRPQLCKDFNCVSWAKVSNNRDQYNRVLKKLGVD